VENVDQSILKVWQLATDPILALAHTVTSALPNLFGALLLLGAGYLLGRAVGWGVRRVAAGAGLDTLADKAGLSAFLQRWGAERPLSELLGGLVFAFVFLAFILSAAEALGLEAASSAVGQVMLFLPKFAAAMFVLVLGLMVASWLSAAVRRMADGVGLEYAATLQRFAMGVLTALVVLVAVDQLDIRIILLQEIIAILLGALGVALALSLGLGTRTLSSQIISGVYVRDLVQEGDRIELGDLRAVVVEVGTVKTLVRLDDGRILTLPNARLIRESFTIDRAGDKG